MTARFDIEPHAAAIPQLRLVDREAGSELWLAPSRGALVTRFFDGRRELLYLDEATFLDAGKNVRGGIPVLFPSPGKLTGDRWARDGKSGELKQHGFARTSAWALVRQSTEASAEVTLRLASSPQTLRDYPWPFRVELTYALRAAALRISIRVFNTGAEAMPYGFGFHPYFFVPLAEKAGARIDTAATRAWDNVEKRERPLGEIALGQGESDLHLLDHGSTQSALRCASGAVEVVGSDAFVRWVIWTLPGKEFVCLEPWTGPGNGLNSGEGLRWLAAGADETLSVEIRG